MSADTKFGFYPSLPPSDDTMMLLWPDPSIPLMTGWHWGCPSKSRVFCRVIKKTLLFQLTFVVKEINFYNTHSCGFPVSLAIITRNIIKFINTCNALCLFFFFFFFFSSVGYFSLNVSWQISSDPSTLCWHYAVTWAQTYTTSRESSDMWMLPPKDMLMYVRNSHVYCNISVYGRYTHWERCYFFRTPCIMYNVYAQCTTCRDFRTRRTAYSTCLCGFCPVTLFQAKYDVS